MLHEELIWRNMVLMSHQPLSWSSNKKITSHTCFKLHASSSTLHPCQWLGDTEFLTATLVHTNATWGSNLKKYGFWKLSVFTSRPLLWLVNTLSYKWLTRNVIHFSQLHYLSTLGSSWSEGMWWWINVLYKASANDGKHKSSMTHIQWSDMYWICGTNCYAGICQWRTVTNEITSHNGNKPDFSNHFCYHLQKQFGLIYQYFPNYDSLPNHYQPDNGYSQRTSSRKILIKFSLLLQFAGTFNQFASDWMRFCLWLPEAFFGACMRCAHEEERSVRETKGCTRPAKSKSLHLSEENMLTSYLRANICLTVFGIEY